MKRRSNVKRIICTLLVLVMVLSWVPGSTLTAHAAAATDNCDGNHDGWKEWTDPNALPKEKGKYYLTNDVAVRMLDSSGSDYNHFWMVPKGETTICLNGHYIKEVSGGSSSAWYSYLISVGSGATLNLHDCKGSGYIRRPSSSYGAICVFPDGVLNMYGGTIKDSGTGVYLEHPDTNGKYTNGARFNMYGGTISGCNTASVYVNTKVNKPNGGFYMYGGTLENKVYMYYTSSNFSASNYNTLHYFGGTISPKVLIGNGRSIYVASPLNESLRLEVDYGGGFNPGDKLAVAEKGYTLTAEDALKILSPNGKKLPVVENNSITLKEVKTLDSEPLRLDPINYGQKANEAGIHGSVTVDGSTPFAGRFWIEDTKVYNAGTHNVNVKFQAEGRSEVLTYSVPLTVNRRSVVLTWEEADANQTQQLKTLAQNIIEPKPDYAAYEGEILYSYRPADAADADPWTDGLPTAIGTYTVKAHIPQTNNYNATESSNTITLTVIDVPDAPANMNVTLNTENGTATVTWQAPAYVGSSAITGYKAEWLKDGAVIQTEDLTADDLSSTLTLTDAAQNGSYTFRVTAINAVGTGATAQKDILASKGMVVTGVEVNGFDKRDYVENETLQLQSVRANLTYNDGTTQNVPIEQLYEMGAWLELRKDDGTIFKTIVDYKAPPVLALEDHYTYLWLVVPTGILEETFPCKPYYARITVGKAYPSEPQNLAARVGDGKLDVTWEEPAITYGKEILGYTIVCKNGNTVETKNVDADARSVTFDGLTNETTYTIEIQAENSNGLGAKAKVTAKPSTYAVIRVTACPKILFGDDGPTAPRDGKIIYDFSNLTDLKVEFLSDVLKLENGDGLLVTFNSTKLTDGFDMNQKFRVEPKVQVVDKDGNVKNDHPYTIFTKAQEISYSERDIGEDPNAKVLGVEYNEASVVEYTGKVIKPAYNMLYMKRGGYYMPWFPTYTQETITRKYYDYVILDPQGNQVDGYRDVGEYTVVLTGKNGCTGTLSGKVTVTPRYVQIRAKKQELTYGDPLIQGADAAETVYSLRQNHYLKELTVTADSYDVTPSGSDRYVKFSNVVIWDSERNVDVTSNYDIEYLIQDRWGKLTIKKANNPTIDFTSDPITLEYNNGQPVANPTEDMLTFTGAYYKDIKFQWQNSDGTVLPTAPTEMGNYKLKAYLENNDNHGAAEATVNVKIGGKRLDEADMTLSQDRFTYNGTAHKPTVTVTDGETVIEKSKYTVTYGNNTNAGTATVTVVDNDATDTYEIGATLTFTIDPCPLDGLTASVNNAGSIVYDGAEQTPGVTVTGPNGTALTADTDYTVTYTNNVNAGEAAAVITAVEGGNYTGTKTLPFAIAPKPVTVTANNAQKVYGENDPALTYTAVGLVDGESLTDITCTRLAGEDVDSYEITPSQPADANPNYAITFEKGTFTITRKPIAVPTAETGLVYDGTEQTGVKEGEGYTLTGHEETNAGTHTATVTPDQNHQWSDNGGTEAREVEWTIAPKPVTVTANNAQKVYHEQDPALAYTADGLVEGESLTGITCTRSDGEDVGDYEITPSQPADANPNYAITFEKGTFTITRKPIPVPTAQTDLVYNGNVRTGVLEGEGYTLTGHEETNAGTYTAKVTPDKNHQWSDNNGTEEREVEWTIAPKPVTVTANNAQKVYHDQDPALTYTADGLVEGESLTDITCTRSDGEDVGYYGITPSQPEGANPNYAITFVEGTFTITHKPIAVPTAETGLVYDGTEKTGVVAGEGYTLTGHTGTDAGTYTAIATLDSNYCWKDLTTREPQNIEWSIAKAPGNLSVGVNQTVEKTYGDPTFALNATHDGPGAVTYESGNTNVATVSADGTVTLQNVGDATITVTLPETDNYLGGQVTVKLTVVQKQATLTVDKLVYEVTYGDAAFTIGYEKESENDPEFTSDNPAVATVDQNGKVEIKGAGTAQITVKIPQSQNYKEVSQTVTVKVNPKKITVTADDKNKTYGDADPALTYTPDGLVGTDSLTGITATRKEGENVGEYTVTLTQEDGANPNYDITFEEGTFTITRKPIAVPTAESGLVYDGTKQTGVKEGEGYTLTGHEETNAGTYTATVTPGQNHQWSDNGGTEERTVEWKIAPKPVTVTANNAQKVYDENDPALTYTADGLVEGESLTGITCTRLAGEDVGDYGITPSQPEGANPNYAITFEKGTFTVTHKPIAVPTAETGLVYNGTEKTGVLAGEGYTLTGTTGTDAGTYTAVATLGSNYCWKDLTTRDPQNVEWKIAKAPGNLAVGVTQTEEKTYKDPAFALNAKHDGPGVMTYESSKTDVATVGEDGTVTLKNVGKATITVTLPETGNYLGGQVTVTLEVVRKQATLTVDKLTYEVTYGDAAFTIGYEKEAENAPEFTSDNPAVATVDQNGQVEIKGAGTAQITVKIPQSQNYKEVIQTVTVKVNPKKITVTAEDKTKTYGDADPALTYTPDGLVGTDSLTGITATRKEGENVGEYTVTLTQKDGANPNYDVKLVTGKMTIQPRDIKDAEAVLGPALIANGQEQTQTVNVTLEGYPNLTCTVEGNKAVKAGGYTMTITGTGNFTGTISQSYAVAPAAAQPADADEEGNPELGEGKVQVEVEIPEDSIMAMDTTKKEIIEILTRSGALTASELAQVVDGTPLKITVLVTETVSDQDKALINALAGEFKVGDIFDISLSVQLGDGQPRLVHQIDKPLHMTVQVPESLISTDPNVTQTFRIIRCHNGEAMFLTGEYDKDAHTLPIISEKFSGYAIVYQNTTTDVPDPTEPTEPGTEATDPTEPTEPSTGATDPTEPTEPSTGATDPTEPSTGATDPTTAKPDPTNPGTGDTSRVDLWLAMMVMSALGLGIVLSTNRKKKTNG